MSIIGIIYAVLIALKIAGVALVTTSWWIVLLWPIPVLLIIFVLVTLGALGASALAVGRYR